MTMIHVFECSYSELILYDQNEFKGICTTDTPDGAQSTAHRSFFVSLEHNEVAMATSVNLCFDRFDETTNRPHCDCAAQFPLLISLVGRRITTVSKQL